MRLRATRAWGSELRSCSIGARVWHITTESRSIRLRSLAIRLAASMYTDSACSIHAEVGASHDPALMYCLAAVMIRPGRWNISAGGRMFRLPGRMAHETS